MSDDHEVEQQLRGLQTKVAQLDKDVAVVRVEMKGIHTEMGDIKSAVHSAAELGLENKNLLTELRGKMTGAWWMLAILQIVVGTGLAILGIGNA